MLYRNVFSIAAALAISGVLLHASPDNGEKRNQNDDRNFVNESHFLTPIKGNRDTENRWKDSYRSDKEVRVPATPKAMISNPKYERTRQVQTPRREEVRKQPITGMKNPMTHRPPDIAVHTIKKHQLYRRPPGVKPLPYYHRPGYVVHTLPRVTLTLGLNGLLIYYSDGIYYRHLHSGFVVSAPPVGLIIPILPTDHTLFVVGGNTYYYYADVYYVWDDYRNAYRVVNAPEDVETYRPGDVVDALPDGAYSITIDGVQYYRYAGIYFLQSRQGERIVYVVVTP